MFPLSMRPYDVCGAQGVAIAPGMNQIKTQDKSQGSADKLDSYILLPVLRTNNRPAVALSVVIAVG
jgi:hypothetical protein